MRLLFSISLACLLVVSCGQGDSNLLKINIDKALRRPVGSQELYTGADVIPLRCPDGTSFGQEGRLVMDVAADRFFLLDEEKNEILFFDWNGSFVTSVKCEEPVIDFSVYQDLFLDVLTEKAIFEYAIDDGTLTETYAIQDNDVTLKCVARVDDDSIDMLGYLNGYVYDCGYTIGKNRFYSVARPAPDHLASNGYVPASEVQNSRFFRCDDSVYSFQSHSGEIYGYTEDDFIWPAYVFDFGGSYLSVTNVQKTADRIYLAFESEGADHVLVYDLAGKEYKVVRQTKEGTAFPLGVIYSGSNYYCCPASSLSLYLPSSQAEGLNGPVIIRYSL
jgi:hypothetical protein